MRVKLQKINKNIIFVSHLPITYWLKNLNISLKISNFWKTRIKSHPLRMRKILKKLNWSLTKINDLRFY
jgi:hypothetical protein